MQTLYPGANRDHLIRSTTLRWLDHHDHSAHSGAPLTALLERDRVSPPLQAAMRPEGPSPATLPPPLFCGPRRCWREWLAIGSSLTVVNWIRTGVHLSWTKHPPPPYKAPPIPVAPSDKEWLKHEITKNLERGSWIRLQHRPTWCAAAFITRNAASGKPRIVIDLRFVNQYLRNDGVRYDSLKTLKNFIRPGDYMISMDLASGYHHLGIASDDCKFLGFELDGEFYQCRALPFGLSIAPRVFTKVMRQLVRYLRFVKVRVLPFLDDFLFLGRTADYLSALADTIDQLLARLGLQRNLEKGQWTPTQQLQHLGMQITTSPEPTIRTTERNIARIREFATSLQHLAARRQRWVPRSMIQRFTGLVISQWLAVPLARANVRELYNALARTHSATKCHLTTAALTELKFWAMSDWPTENALSWPTPQLEVASDASDYAWGATVREMSDTTAPAHPLADARGYFTSTERTYPIMIKEALAVQRALDAFEQILRGRHVLWRVDNASVGFALLNLTSRNASLRQLVVAIWEQMQRLNIRAVIRWISSEDNAEADDLSRRTDRDDWKLNPNVFRSICNRFGEPEIDLFASRANAQVSRFCSRYNDSLAYATDALAIRWGFNRMYANPPWRLIPAVLRKLSTEPHGICILILPQWTAAWWWPMLLDMAESILTIPTTPHTFLSGRSGSIRGFKQPPWDAVAALIPQQRAHPSQSSWRRPQSHYASSSL